LAQDKPAGDKPAGDRPAGERGGRPGGRFGNPEERIKWMTEKLSLTPEQQEKIKAIYAKNEEKNKALREKGFQNLTEDEKKAAMEARRAQMEEVNAVLTPEQQAKMKELAPQGGRRGEGRGDRKPGEGKPADKQ
jgi:Spy/CpxP family protein refolding chaperone